MIKVFISGPYTKGDVAINVKNAMDVADELLVHGFAPYCPHLTHFLHLNNPKPYDVWLALDKEFLSTCDLVLRLPGESTGADSEIAWAIMKKIPIYHSLEDIYKDYPLG
jgi:hypothetical protein